ncbi:shikimate kinase [Trichlorobacter lovleyi]|uniref:shikimate kinase n=1 Tax=Trichlorobacter lovleyi TaxID=313985 RepID=UPI003D15341C
MPESIILTGPMGSGKTSVGQLLAARLGYRFQDLDALLVEQAGKSINQIFADEGEAAFRERETALLATLVGQHGIILSTGGGVVIREANRRLLHAGGLVVNLTATVPVLAGRLALADDRPLLKGDEALEARIERIMTERESFYADADIRIDTTGKTLEDVAAEILAVYAEKRSGAL